MYVDRLAKRITEQRKRIGSRPSLLNGRYATLNLVAIPSLRNSSDANLATGGQTQF